MTIKMQKMAVNGNPISLYKRENGYFISLTDLVSDAAAGSDPIEKWMRSNSAIPYLTAWEQRHNGAFKSEEIGGLQTVAAGNPLASVVRQWITKTGAVGLAIKTGSSPGLYAHADIAFEAASWLSPGLKVLLVDAFEDFKRAETSFTRGNWDLQRRLSKANYKMQARAIKENILPTLSIPKGEEGPVYAEEGDMLNLAVFGKTSQDWKEENSAMARRGFNIRDTATLPQLTVLSNLASYNALLIQQGLSKEARLLILEGAGSSLLQSLHGMPGFSAQRLQSPHAKRLHEH